MNAADLVIPLITALIVLTGLIKKVNVFDEFMEGAKENLQTSLSLLPSLIALVTAIGLFKASGLPELIAELMSPLTTALGFPSECIPLALIRPISGSGALAVFDGILRDCHPDSYAGRVASVLMGSTETTFYTIAVYFAAVKAKDTRHALPSALAGDLTGFIVSAITVRILFGIC